MHEEARQEQMKNIRACSHKMNVRIFEHNFGEYKAKKWKHTDVWWTF